MHRRGVLRDALVLVVLGGGAFVASAQSIQRCEDTSGKVTYVNGMCPPDARAVRNVAPEPAPDAAAQKLASDRARRDAVKLKQVEKQQAAEQAAAAQRAQLARASADKRAAECRKLELRLGQSKDAAATGSLKQRPERQRKLQLAEEHYVRDCGPLPR